MARVTDDKLEKLLAEYYESEPSKSLIYRGDKEEKSAAIPFLPLRRAAVTAAVLVLVTALSVTMFFLFKFKENNSVIPAPSSQSSNPSEQGGGSGDKPRASENSTDENEQSDGAPASTAPRSVTPEPSEKSPVPARETIAVKPTQKNDPAQKPTESVYVPPTDSPNKPEETEKVISQPTEKSVKPTQSTHVTPTEQSTPVSPTHVSPTVPNAPPWEPEEPTDSGDDPPEPVVYPTQPEPKNYCYAYFRYDGGDLFCYIEDENGAVMGDPDLYSAQHSAEIVYTYGNGYVLARWSPNEHGIHPSGGYPRYCFYDSEGETVFADYVHAQGVN